MSKNFPRDENTDLLKEINDNFNASRSAWYDIRKEAQTDMCLVSGRPWDMTDETRKDKADRIKNGRPVLSLDEISQYTNAVKNSFRDNKRAIKLEPTGDGAQDKDAEFRAGLIRQIEYKSNAQSAYITAAENAVDRSYGWFRIARQYYDEDSFDQELCIKRIANPDSVYPDPNFKEIDASDMQWLFFLDFYSEKEFNANWPDAEVKSFTPETAQNAPGWVDFVNKQIQVAEYWRVELKKRTLILLSEQLPAQFVDEIEGAKIKGDQLVYPDGFSVPVLKQRDVNDHSVVQYITNGIEILEKNEWPGKWIPFVPVFGRELFIDRGSGVKRELHSLIRLARDPAMLYNFYRCNEAESVGMVPKSKWLVLEGQIAETDIDDWVNANRNPKAFLKYQVVADPSTGTPIVKAPERADYEPPIQALEIGAEAARRAIQSAIGQMPLPTSAQRLNDKSGVALQKIEQSREHGSSHFQDNFNTSLMHAGRILDDLIDHTYDTERQVGLRHEDDSYQTVKINGAPMAGQDQPFHVGHGKYDVTISVGPSYQSQHEEAGDFIETLVQNMRGLPIPPTVGLKMLAQMIRMKQLGPIGDKIVKLLDPEPGDPAQMQMQLGQMNQQLMMAKQIAQAMQQKLSQLQMEKQARMQESASKEKIAALQAKVDVYKAILQATTKVEEITSDEKITQYQAEADRLQAEIDATTQQAPEAGLPLQ